MKKNVIVSLADSNYFPLLNELIDSIKRFKESSEVSICILDAGLSEDQKTELSSKVDEIKSAEWDIKVPELLYPILLILFHQLLMIILSFDPLIDQHPKYILKLQSFL